MFPPVVVGAPVAGGAPVVFTLVVFVIFDNRGAAIGSSLAPGGFGLRGSSSRGSSSPTSSPLPSPMAARAAAVRGVPLVPAVRRARGIPAPSLDGATPEMNRRFRGATRVYETIERFATCKDISGMRARRVCRRAATNDLSRGRAGNLEEAPPI